MAPVTPAMPTSTRTAAFADARRVVVKVGSALLSDGRGGLRHDWIASLADDIAALRRRGVRVLLVSSGAIAVGRRRLAPARRSLALEEKQACAAVGQIRLAHAWQQAFARHDATVAQLLLTPQDSEDRRRYLNARNTIDALLRLDALPLINENDTVATEEIRFGDNDRLAARVAQMAGADILVLLSDVDGLYTADPRRDPEARRLDEVRAVTPEIAAMAGGSPTDTGSGGMITKIEAARIALRAGCHMAIVEGAPARPLTRLEAGAPCTWFRAEASPLTARKQWIAGGLRPAGALTVDAGAARALAAGKSLLPAGVTAAEGDFGRGDLVAVRDTDAREIARGLCAYGGADARAILGRRSDEIERLLGYRGREEIIHRDDLVLAAGPAAGAGGGER